MLMGSATAVLILGPEDAPTAALKAARRKLRSLVDYQPFVTNAEDEAPLRSGTRPLSWASFNVGTGGPTASPIEGHRVVHLARALREIVDATPQVGAYLDVGRGLNPGGDALPFGIALDGIQAGRPWVRAGELRVTPAVAELVRALSPLRLRETEGEPASILSQAPAPQPWSEQVLAWLSGTARETFAAFQLTLAPISPLRSAAPQVQGLRAEPGGTPQPLTPGTDLQLSLRCPDLAYAYVILRRGRRLVPLNDGRPIHLPGDGTELAYSIALGQHPEEIQPLVLLSTGDIQGLPALARALAPDTPDEDLPGALLQRIQRQGPVTGIGLFDPGTFLVTPPTPPTQAPAYLAALRDMEEDNYPGALAHLRSLLREDPEPEARAEFLVVLGRCLQRMDLYDDALDTLREADELARQLRLVALQGDAQRGMAWTLLKAKRPPQALRCLKQAKALHTAGADLVAVSKDLQLEGNILARRGELEAALAAFKEALPAATQAEEHRLLGTLHGGIAQIHHDLGDLAAARRSANRSLGAFQRSGDLRGEFRSRSDLGLIAHDEGDAQAAAEAFRICLEIAQEVGPESERPNLYAGLAMAAVAMRDFPEAEDALDHLFETLAPGDDVLRAIGHTLQAELALLREDLPGAEAALSQIGEDRGALPPDVQWRLSLAEGRRLSLAGSERAPEAFQRGIQALEDARGRLSLRHRLHFLSTSAALYDGWLDTLLSHGADGADLLRALEQSQARAFLDALLERGPMETEEGESGADAQDLPSSRPKKKAQPGAQGAIATVHVRVVEGQVLFLWKGEGAPQVRTLSHQVGDLQARVRALKAECRRREGPLDEALWAEMSALLLEPIRKEIESLRPEDTLYFIPHGCLHGIPFHALWLGAERAPLILSVGVAYAPSIGSIEGWRRLKERPAGERVILADPHGDLPEALGEGLDLVQRLGGSILKTGPEASAAALLQAARSASLLHIAAHAQRQRPGAPAVLHLRGRDTDGLDPDLAGYTDAIRSGKIDPRLIQSLSVRAELVTLSTCDSAAGEPSAAGEGLDLLSWAFLYRGARSVVACLWPLSDAEGRRIISAFYDALLLGAPRSQALAKAQREAFWRQVERSSPGYSPGGSAPLPPVSPNLWAIHQLMGHWGPISQLTQERA